MNDMRTYYLENDLRATRALLAAGIWYGPGKPVWPKLWDGHRMTKSAQPVKIAKPLRQLVVDKENVTPVVYIAAAANLAGVDTVDLMVKNRTPPVVAARRAAIIAIWENFPTWGVTRIARLFDCDHSTISHALRKDRSPKIMEAAQKINNLIAEKLSHA